MNKVQHTKECNHSIFGKIFIPDNEPCDMWENYEISVSNAIIDRVDEKTIFIDIGANWGYYSLFIANKVRKVFSIEPNPLIFNMLYNNTLRYPNIETYNIAMSDKVGIQKFYYRYGVWETAILFPPKSDDDNFFNERDTTIETLSSFWNKFGMGSDDDYNVLIKMDCEGSEFHILRDVEFFKNIVYGRKNGSKNESKRINKERKKRKCVVILELHRIVIETERNFGYLEFAEFLDKNFNMQRIDGTEFDVYNMGSRDFVILELDESI